MIREDFLQFVWQAGLSTKPEMTLTDGRKFTILDRGKLHSYSGPDFKEAKVKIDNLIWSGHIEIHVFASEWYVHKHQEDPAYDNVIVHVVWENNKQVYDSNGLAIPTLELKNYIPPKVLESYKVLVGSLHKIPCKPLIGKVRTLIVKQMLNRVISERLEDRFDKIDELLIDSSGDWGTAFYIMMSRSFGFNTNAEPMEELAKRLPQRIPALYKNDLMMIEALLFGLANLIPEKPTDDYADELKTQFEFLQNKHQLTCLSPALWKFGRIRPQNYPTLRLAQFASLIHSGSHLFSKTLEIENIQTLKQLFKVEPSDYWKKHLKFGQVSKLKSHQLSENAINLILINTVIPMVFCYGVKTGDAEQQEKALYWLEQLPSESNRIINEWVECELHPSNALESQAMIKMYRDYCTQKNCAQCLIGYEIMQAS